MSGKAGRSGRKPCPKTIMNEALEKWEPHQHDVAQRILDIALSCKNDKLALEACVYIQNRKYGTPTQSLVAKIDSEVHWTADQYRVAIAEARVQENFMLSGVKDVIEVGNAEEIREAVEVTGKEERVEGETC